MSADSTGHALSRRPSYARHRADQTPNALLVDALSILGPSRGRALDIGAGSLSSSRHLLSAGFTVDAVDPDPHARELAGALDDRRLSFRCADIRALAIAPRTYTLIVAIHVLHLLPRRDLDALMPAVVGGLADDGLLCVTFLGVRDSWAPTPWRATVLPRDDVHSLTAGLEIVRLDELEYDGTNVLGQAKHWHTLRCILRKRERDSDATPRDATWTRAAPARGSRTSTPSSEPSGCRSRRAAR